MGGDQKSQTNLMLGEDMYVMENNWAAIFCHLQICTGVLLVYGFIEDHLSPNTKNKQEGNTEATDR